MSTIEDTDDSYIEFEGNKYHIDTFTTLNIRDGEVLLVNPTISLGIQIDIDNDEQMRAFGIPEFNIRMIRAQLDRVKEEGEVPAGYEKKYCAIFGGKVFHSFDTQKELDDFRNGPKNVGLMYTFYYPEL